MPNVERRLHEIRIVNFCSENRWHVSFTLFAKWVISRFFSATSTNDFDHIYLSQFRPGAENAVARKAIGLSPKRQLAAIRRCGLVSETVLHCGHRTSPRRAHWKWQLDCIDTLRTRNANRVNHFSRIVACAHSLPCDVIYRFSAYANTGRYLILNREFLQNGRLSVFILGNSDWRFNQRWLSDKSVVMGFLPKIILIDARSMSLYSSDRFRFLIIYVLYPPMTWSLLVSR